MEVLLQKTTRFGEALSVGSTNTDDGVFHNFRTIGVRPHWAKHCGKLGKLEIGDVARGE